MELHELNHWWELKHVKEEFSLATFRDLFYDVKKELDRKQIQIIVGLRRAGKSTILFQITDYLIKNNVNPLNIVYCSFDELELQEKTIEGILKEYSKITNVDYKKEKIYLLIDEAQKSKNWVSGLKLIYDNLRNIKILVSGSASLNILSEAKKSLAGRVIYYELKPLNFKEFLRLKGINIEKNKYLIYKDKIEKEFNQFILRSFPELINENDSNFIKNYIRNSVIEPIILKDIPKEFKEVDILLLEKLVNVFLSNPGRYLIVDNFAKELKRAKTTIYKALFYLEFSFLIKKILNFRPSINIASRKLSRIYAYHQSLSLPFNISQEKYAENLVLSELDAKYYWRDKEKEIDFLKDFIPVEVKFKSKIEKDDIKWINYFTQKYGKKYNIKKAYVITKDCEGNINGINLMPLWKLCFMGL